MTPAGATAFCGGFDAAYSLNTSPFLSDRLLSLLEWREFARRCRGVDVVADAPSPPRRSALTLAGFVVSLLIPGTARAVVAGAGAVLAFAGALGAGIARRPGDRETDA
jgi:hypothetical protein